MVQSTTFQKKKFRECFVARQVIYCIGKPDERSTYDHVFSAPSINNTMQLVYDTKNQLTIPVTIVIPDNMKNVVSLQFSKYESLF